jgi:penicillin-binding protein 2
VTLPPVDPHLEALRHSDKPPLRDDFRFAANKIAVFQYLTVVIFVILVSAFWRLQVQNPQFYDERAVANSVKSVPIPGPRGRILDREGRVIVDNHASFSLRLARELLKEGHLKPIAQGLDLDYDDLVARVRRYRHRPKYEALPLKEELTPLDLAFVDSHRDFFPELFTIDSQRRVYPQNGMLAHVLGYTGEITEAQLDQPEFARYDQGAVIGQFGVEQQYNDVLMGQDGQRQVIVDNTGQVRQQLKEKPAVAGKDLKLTIDLDLQAVAELSLEGRNGAVVALDPRNGEVLAMLSHPAFDPNKFAVRIRAADWKEIRDNPDKPMLNRAIQAQQAPGSTFKPTVALAALESGTIDEQFSVHCAGGASFYGDYHRCHLKGGHGTVTLHRGIVQSCDVYFYTVGNMLGIDKIAYYADLVGFGHKTGIDLPNEKEGTVPSTQWAMRNYHRKWYAGETISVAIGQGPVTVTPLQLARAIGGIAMGGVWQQPHLVQTAKVDKPVTWSLDPVHVKDVVDGMYGVVNEWGTGAQAQIPGLQVCGKTGTAQVESSGLAKATGGVASQPNAWFVGFAPCYAPEIVVAAIWDHGAEGPYVAPIVRDILKAYFDKKTRLTMLQQQQSAEAARLATVSRLDLPGPPGPR